MSLQAWMQEHLLQMGLGKSQRWRSVGGGSINAAWEVVTNEGHFFVKMNQPVDRSFFQHEVDGLEAIRETRTIRVPEVIGHRYDDEKRCAMLVLEWVAGTKSNQTEEKLGVQLAQMHQSVGEAFGWEKDNLIGQLPQLNRWMDDWVDFYREQRLMPQLKWGVESQKITGERRKRLGHLMDQLNQWLDRKVQPSLLHGDLWGGNWIVGPNGEPYLIDPAVFFGHAEMDLAFSELFGGFSERFYRAYEEVHPLGQDYQERKELYQLYYLLVHLNCFGETYGLAVDRVLARYT